jgi:hypothetical protein
VIDGLPFLALTLLLKEELGCHCHIPPVIKSVPFGSHQFAGKGKGIAERNVGSLDETRAKEGYRPLARNNFLGNPM